MIINELHAKTMLTFLVLYTSSVLPKIHKIRFTAKHSYLISIRRKVLSYLFSIPGIVIYSLEFEGFLLLQNPFSFQNYENANLYCFENRQVLYLLSMSVHLLQLELFSEKYEKITTFHPSFGLLFFF